MKEEVDEIATVQERPRPLLAAFGAVLFVAGSKLVSVALVLYGLWQLERAWRRRHGFEGTWKERCDIAAHGHVETHKHPINRGLHMVGIPIVLLAAAAMLELPRWQAPWLVCLGVFFFGWSLNILGHALWGREVPPLADEPLAFIVGPLRDVARALAPSRR